MYVLLAEKDEYNYICDVVLQTKVETLRGQKK